LNGEEYLVLLFYIKKKEDIFFLTVVEMSIQMIELFINSRTLYQISIIINNRYLLLYYVTQIKSYKSIQFLLNNFKKFKKKRKKEKTKNVQNFNSNSINYIIDMARNFGGIRFSLN
jgi:hypothetical protein